MCSTSTRRVIGGKFDNGIGKARFIISEIDPHDLRPGEYLMTTGPQHDQFNTDHLWLNDRYASLQRPPGYFHEHWKT